MKHEDEKTSKAPTTPHDNGPQKASEPSEIKRELTDQEIAEVAGGNPGWITIRPVPFR